MIGEVSEGPPDDESGAVSSDAKDFAEPPGLGYTAELARRLSKLVTGLLKRIAMRFASFG